LDYNVYTTPTMFVVDQSQKVIWKPITFSELKIVLIG